MVLTAWYHLGMRVNRAHTERLLREEASGVGEASTVAANSTAAFLSQQRRIRLQPSNRSVKPPTGPSL